MPTLAKKENELIDSCDYSCEHHPTRLEKAGDRSPDNATDQTPDARRVYAGVDNHWQWYEPQARAVIWRSNW